MTSVNPAAPDIRAIQVRKVYQVPGVTPANTDTRALKAMQDHLVQKAILVPLVRQVQMDRSDHRERKATVGASDRLGRKASQ